MNVRGRYIPAAAGWAALVAGLLVGVPLLLRDRLPDPVAYHWGPSGAPDGTMPLSLIWLVPLTLWVILAGGVLAVMTWGTVLRRRRPRGWAGAALAGGAVYLLGLHALTVHANLDRASWRDAAHIGPQVLIVIVLAVLAAWAGWRLLRPGPDEARAPAHWPTLAHELRPDERAVWVSSLTVPWAVGLASAFLAAVVVSATLTMVEIGIRGYLVVVFALIALDGFALSAIRVQADRRGLAIAFGPLRWPVYRIPLRRVESAWVETRRPSDVGGWGYRGLPGGATIMLRGGECLVVRYASGGKLAISIDDAERGAALLNALIAEGVQAGDR